MNSRSELLIQTVQEYHDFMSKMNSSPEKSAYMDKVYKMLIDMKPGTRIETDRICSPANLPQFVRTVCLYFWDYDNIEFDREYRFIKKLEKFPIPLQN